MALDRREFEQFMNQARVKLPGASDSGIRLELYDVCKEFLADSNAWREDISFQPVTTQQDYELTPVHAGQIIRLMGVWDDKLIPIPALMHEFGEVRLMPPPSATPATLPLWMARVVKNVTLPTTREDVPIVPEQLLRVYSVHLLDGLLGKMMGQQAKSYSNSAMSMYHLKRFRTGIVIARTAAARDNLVGGQEWAFPRGWTSRSQRGGVSTAWPTRAF